MAFPDENKPSPKEIAKAVVDAEAAIGLLQLEQTRYNLAVKVQLEGEEVPLLFCVKMLGGLGRVEKMWRGASTIKDERYFGDRNVRDKDQLVAARTVSYEDASKETAALDKRLGRLREAIANGNARVVEMNLDATLFE